MKNKIAIFIITVLLCISILPVSVLAASANASLTGPDTVRVGDTVTVTFKVSGSGVFGASGKLSYDSNQVRLSGTSQKIVAPWAVEFNGNDFVAYDNNLSNPINSTQSVFTATFVVKSVSVGTAIKISVDNVVASDGTQDISIGSVSTTATVAAPLSANANLASLKVGNATISPAFSADTTKYTASVPFDISKLNVTASAADAKAKVSVNSPTLKVNGTTDVTVTVTAENGNKKSYTISVKRAQDPNYTSSGNNKLSDISVDGFRISPVFSADVDSYVVWLPYEVDNIKVSGKASDGKAAVEVIGGDDLEAGKDNTVKVICTAENGEKKEYTVIAKRAYKPGEEPKETESTDTKPNDTDTNKVDTNNVETPSGGIAWWWLLIVGVLALAVGFVGGIFGKKYLFKKY